MGRSSSLLVDELALIRPALVQAVAVAKAGATADPPLPAPDGIRRVLGFRRLQNAALTTVRRVVEGDDDFRQRVIEASSEEELGRAAWVWLTRPPDWLQEMQQLFAAAQVDAEGGAEEREAARLRRARTGAEEAARRHEAEAQQAKEEGRRARAEVNEERKLRRVAERDSVAARELAEGYRTEREGLEQKLRATEVELDQVRHALDVARAALHEAEAELGSARPERVQMQVDLAGLEARVAGAASVAAELSSALVDIAGELATSGSAEGAAGPASISEATDAAQQDAVRSRSAVRRPAAAPPGVRDDSAEAAAHVMRLPAAVVLVDGYNVARTAWGGLEPEEERARLIAALEELHARMGPEVTVVFDGVQAGGPITGQASRTIRVRFTAEGTSADDELRDLIDHFPVARPVVVVSSDREVADGARARGANAISSRQFLSALGR